LLIVSFIVDEGHYYGDGHLELEVGLFRLLRDRNNFTYSLVRIINIFEKFRSLRGHIG